MVCFPRLTVFLLQAVSSALCLLSKWEWFWQPTRTFRRENGFLTSSVLSRSNGYRVLTAQYSSMAVTTHWDSMSLGWSWQVVLDMEEFEVSLCRHVSSKWSDNSHFRGPSYLKIKSCCQYRNNVQHILFLTVQACFIQHLGNAWG